MSLACRVRVLKHAAAQTLHQDIKIYTLSLKADTPHHRQEPPLLTASPGTAATSSLTPFPWPDSKLASSSPVPGLPHPVSSQSKYCRAFPVTARVSRGHFQSSFLDRLTTPIPFFLRQSLSLMEHTLLVLLFLQLLLLNLSCGLFKNSCAHSIHH